MLASTDHVDGLDSNMSAKITTCQCEASSMYIVLDQDGVS